MAKAIIDGRDAPVPQEVLDELFAAVEQEDQGASRGWELVRSEIAAACQAWDHGITHISGETLRYCVEEGPTGRMIARHLRVPEARIRTGCQTSEVKLLESQVRGLRWLGVFVRQLRAQGYSTPEVRCSLATRTPECGNMRRIDTLHHDPQGVVCSTLRWQARALDGAPPGNEGLSPAALALARQPQGRELEAIKRRRDQQRLSRNRRSR